MTAENDYLRKELAKLLRYSFLIFSKKDQKEDLILDDSISDETNINKANQKIIVLKSKLYFT
jgi:hypothetical protein